MAGVVWETAVLKDAGKIEVKKKEPAIRKGPIEGLLIVDGLPQTERADMPTISFDSIAALLKVNGDQERKD